MDFRVAREKLNLTQAELASKLGISETQVNSHEQVPQKIPPYLESKWLQILIGEATFQVRPDVVIECTARLVEKATAASQPQPSSKIEGIDPGHPYAELHCRLNVLLQYIDEAPGLDTLDLPNKPPTPNDLREQIKDYFHKPNLVLTGGFDAGKSYMANALLGKDVLPVGYQPGTRVITFVRHLSNRPSRCQNDVLIM